MQAKGFSLGMEVLESRRCLTATAEVVGGNLLISGVAGGDLSITAVETGAFLVTDGEVEIGNFSGVTRDIRLKLDAGGELTDDSVTIDLAGQSVRRVLASLGDGDNTLIIQGGTASRGLVFNAGDGDDSLEIAEDATIQGDVLARLGEGDNKVAIGGHVRRGVAFHTGEGDDELTMEAVAVVERGILACLGDGDNQVSLEGEIGRKLTLKAGDGNDSVDLLADALVGRSATISLGSGDNSLLVEGEISGNLSVTSSNPDDEFTVSDTALVAGEVNLTPGGLFASGLIICRPPAGNVNRPDVAPVSKIDENASSGSENTSTSDPTGDANAGKTGLCGDVTANGVSALVTLAGNSPTSGSIRLDSAVGLSSGYRGFAGYLLSAWNRLARRR